MMDGKIKNIIFDLGNVLINFDPEKYLEANVKEDIRKDFLDEVFLKKEWLDLDRGTLTYEEAKKIFKKRLPQAEKEIDKFFDNDFFADPLRGSYFFTAVVGLQAPRYFAKPLRGLPEVRL